MFSSKMAKTFSTTLSEFASMLVKLEEWLIEWKKFFTGKVAKGAKTNKNEGKKDSNITTSMDPISVAKLKLYLELGNSTMQAM